MLKELDSSKLMKVNSGGHSPYWMLGNFIFNYIKNERSPEEQARIREMNRQHYGY